MVVKDADNDSIVHGRTSRDFHGRTSRDFEFKNVKTETRQEELEDRVLKQTEANTKVDENESIIVCPAGFLVLKWWNGKQQELVPNLEVLGTL